LAVGTEISSAGVLTVAAAESLGALTVTATSSADTTRSGSTGVTVVGPDDNFIDIAFNAGPNPRQWRVQSSVEWAKITANPGGRIRAFTSISTSGHFQSSASPTARLQPDPPNAEGGLFWAETPIVHLLAIEAPFWVEGQLLLELYDPAVNNTLVRLVVVPGEHAYTIPDILGIALPVTGQTAPTTITSNAQFTGGITWSPVLNAGAFAAGTAYTATITLTPRPQFTSAGVPANFFRVATATTVTNPVNSGIITATFPATGGTAGDPTVVTRTDLQGLSLPELGAAPVTTAPVATPQYTFSTVTWSYTDATPMGAAFVANKEIRATFTMTAASGWTFNTFNAALTVAGATSVTYTPNPGTGTTITVTAAFAALEDLADTMHPMIFHSDFYGSGHISSRNAISFTAGDIYEIEFQFSGNRTVTNADHMNGAGGIYGLGSSSGRQSGIMTNIQIIRGGGTVRADGFSVWTDHEQWNLTAARFSVNATGNYHLCIYFGVMVYSTMLV
jgi:hypothetical protein